MSLIFSTIFFIIGIAFIITGQPFMDVAASFMVSGIFAISWNLYYLSRVLDIKEFRIRPLNNKEE